MKASRSHLLAALAAALLMPPVACSNSDDDSGAGGMGTSGGAGSGGKSEAGGKGGSGGTGGNGNSLSGGTTNGGSPSVGGQPLGGGPSCAEPPLNLGGMGGQPSGGDLFVVPEGISYAEIQGDAGGLNLMALTLQEGANGTELYAAIRNDSDAPICYGGISFNFLDDAEYNLGIWADSIHSENYRMGGDAGSGTGDFIQCLGAGRVGMAGTRALPEYILLSEVAHLEYSFPAFAPPDGTIPSTGVTAEEIMVLTRPGGVAVAGRLTNHTESTLTNTSVAVFPVDPFGRPTGKADTTATTDLGPCQTWTFETEIVTAGDSYAVFPSASIVQ